MSNTERPNVHKTYTKGHEIAIKTMKNARFSYIHLRLMAGGEMPHPGLDEVTARTYTTSALTQYLGVTGSAVPIDILKIEEGDCWIRLPAEDLSATLAALGGWVGRGESSGSCWWSVRGSGNWLGALVGDEDVERLWKD